MPAVRFLRDAAQNPSFDGYFVQFLKGINQPDKGKAAVEEWRTEDADDEDYGPYEDKKASIEWAKSLGWSGRKITNKNLL